MTSDQDGLLEGGTPHGIIFHSPTPGFQKNISLITVGYYQNSNTGFIMSYLDEIEKKGQNANPFFCLLGIRPVSWGDGSAVLDMQVRADMTNGEGWLQGGIYTSMVDEAMALAIYTLLNEGEMIATISCTTTFLRGVRAGDTIRAEARVVRRGRQIIFSEGSVSNLDGGTELARCSASFVVRS